MSLEKYEPLFFNANFKEVSADGKWAAYRGELVLEEGEVADAQGRRKPPHHVLKQGVVLVEGDSLKLLSGSMDQLQHLPMVLEKFGADLNADTITILYTVNIANTFVSSVNGFKFVFVPLVQGMTWNELIDMVGLEKSDFKGQGAADKVVTLYKALKSEKFAYPEVSIEEALTLTNNAKREVHGAI
ncbi:MAG: hypothetical protein RIR18_1030 [Pseudomonadota bacterium]|jgi:hypothetical protein